jgi:hypothetical protein
MEDISNNPLLQREDYTAGYKASVEALKNHPELVSFEKMCYEVFYMNEFGKKLMEHLEENFLMRPAAATEHPNFKDLCIWKDGINYIILNLRNSAKSHEQRIKAGTNV